jgi:hypothetical protein
MPFDTVCLANNYEGFPPPGLGTAAYVECITALLEILPWILPTTHPEILAKILAVASASRNRYDLLWRMMELFIPGFDTTIPIPQPYWRRDRDILESSQSHLLYFCLQAKKNVYYSMRDRTNIFLWAVAPSDHANIMTTLQTTVNAYRNPEDDGYLPNHLRIDGIAMMINNNAKHRVQDVGAPRINCVAGANKLWEMVHTPGDATADDYPFCHVQGYCPMAFHLEQGRDCNPGGRGFDQRGFEGGRGSDRRGLDHRNPDPPKGHFARPDKNQHEFKPNVQCDACKCVGHKAATCDMLAIILFLDRYKLDMSEADQSQLESKWLSWRKDKIGQPARTPRQVMRTYCDTLNITPEHLDLAMMWESWPDDVLSDNK